MRIGRESGTETMRCDHVGCGCGSGEDTPRGEEEAGPERIKQEKGQ
jgi:hypothetical protein